MIALCATAAAASFAGAELMRRLSHRLGFTDAPNERSSHSAPTPRAGGIGFALAVPPLTAAGLYALRGSLDAPEHALLVSALALALVGLADDRWRLPASIRFGAHAVAAAALIAAGGIVRDVWLPGAGVLHLGVLAVPLTAVWLVALTNIYNFMDGIDGLAAAQAVIAAAALAAIASRTGDTDLVVGMAVLAGGAAGFLVLNRPPASVFMGDTGSTFLGFMLAGWAVVPREPDAGVPIVAWLAVLSPFLFDSTVTLLKRLSGGERIYEAHRTHFYQRLVQHGWSHARTLRLYAALAALSGGLAAWALAGTGLSSEARAALLSAGLAVPLCIPAIVRVSLAQK
jgi:UDP-N-acetylmuramyl pentapeptide phosphotransferase/UDP-N-acetylglucosamine-1-phosphate transferase